MNIDDKTSDYLGDQWTNTTTNRENKIKILNQLTMTSGLNALAFDCVAPDCLNYIADASTRWEYHYGLYTLFQSVVTSAVDDTFESYLMRN